MASFNKFNTFVQNLVRKEHNLNGDTIYIALATGAPVSTNSQLSNITQVTNGGGYTTGGATAGASVSTNATGTETVRATTNPQWTASGGGFTLQYAVAYNFTTASDLLIGWWDYGSSLTLSGANGDTFTVTGPATSIFTLA